MIKLVCCALLVCMTVGCAKVAPLEWPQESEETGNAASFTHTDRL